MIWGWKLGYKIRDAQTSKIPFSLVIGDKEVESQTVTYRKYGEDKQITTKLIEYVDMIKEIIKKKSKIEVENFTFSYTICDMHKLQKGRKKYNVKRIMAALLVVAAVIGLDLY